MELVALTFASGWTSGINAYATVLVLGLVGRFAGVADVPAGLQRTDVLIVMAILAALEFFADKIPYLDSIWDGISTFIRPVAGAVIGALIAGANGDLLTLTLASLGGVTALLSHAVKSGLRLAVNTSPEPVTNIGASLTGDVAVVSVASLAALYPVQAAVITAILLVATAILLAFAFSRIRKGWRALGTWVATRSRTS
ncbi:MAG: DUF4126 domain-containing protein [Propionibacteriales bacterium]|nr:DUF4126 domain-containing protein [Propionibacteriales bacterium]